MGEILVDVCAYAGTGNVLKIQGLLHLCSEHYDERDEVCLSPLILIIVMLMWYRLECVELFQDNNDKKDDKKSKKKAEETRTAATASKGEEKMETDSSADSGKTEEKAVNKQVAHQGIAVLGIALVAMGEEIGAEMCFRTFGHLVSIRNFSHSIVMLCIYMTLYMLIHVCFIVEIRRTSYKESRTTSISPSLTI